MVGHNITENVNLQQHYCHNLKSCIICNTLFYKQDAVLKISRFRPSFVAEILKFRHI